MRCGRDDALFHLPGVRRYTVGPEGQGYAAHRLPALSRPGDAQVVGAPYGPMSDGADRFREEFARLARVMRA